MRERRVRRVLSIEQRERTVLGEHARRRTHGRVHALRVVADSDRDRQAALADVESDGLRRVVTDERRQQASRDQVELPRRNIDDA